MLLREKNMKKIIATYSETSSLIDKHQLAIRKHWGQNFLIDPNIAEKIVLNSGISSSSAVIEIGAGFGGLTQFILKYADNVIAYEIDPLLSVALKENFEDEIKLTVFNKDFLKVDIKEVVSSLKEKYQEVFLVANLPYYITTPILFSIIDSQVKFNQITLMMQKEVALRLAALPNSKDYGSLSIIVQYLFEVDYLFNISNQVFYPKPKVDSAVIALKRKEAFLEAALEPLFFNFVKQCFKFRRKTVINNLKELNATLEILEILKSLQLDEKIRGEAISLENYLKLFKELYEKKIIC